jgi:hypothetical protein
MKAVSAHALAAATHTRGILIANVRYDIMTGGSETMAAGQSPRRSRGRLSDPGCTRLSAS